MQKVSALPSGCPGGHTLAPPQADSWTRARPGRAQQGCHGQDGSWGHEECPRAQQGGTANPPNEKKPRPQTQDSPQLKNELPRKGVGTGRRRGNCGQWGCWAQGPGAPESLRAAGPLPASCTLRLSHPGHGQRLGWGGHDRSHHGASAPLSALLRALTG